MSIICKNCGKELADNAKFCGGCGSKIEAEPANENTCPACGAPVPANAGFCTICGSAFPRASVPAPSPDEPTGMEELVPPVINDSTFAAAEQPAQDVYNSMEGIATAAQQEVRQAVPETPVISEQPVYQQAQQTYQQAQQVYQQPQQAYQQAQQAFQQPQGYNMPNQPQYQPYPDPTAVPTEQGKKASSVIVPVILIILILGVIAFDVFFLFRDKIFGGDDDSSSKKSSGSKTSVSSVVDDDDDDEKTLKADDDED